MRRFVPAVGAILAVAVWTGLAAQGAEGQRGPADPAVRVYTNEDLDGLPPLAPLVILDAPTNNLDPTVRERKEVETLGISVVGEIPKK